MARKNLIEVSNPHEARPEQAAVSPRDSRPIAGFIPQTRSGGPVGGITKTLGSITEKVERANDLERQLAEGQTVVELDTALIDASFVADRLEVDAAELAQLIEQIREHGQQVPILVRPHPDAKGRYQVAFGHRRLAATKALGIKVKAIVRTLTDGQLVVSQGQENNSRTDLSYIERALFAHRLEEKGFSNDVVMAALNVDRAALSKMRVITRQVPFVLISAIGAAPEIGRRRWLEFGEHLEGKDIDGLVAMLSADYMRSLSSNDRFHQVFGLATKKETGPKPVAKSTQIADLPVKFKRTPATATFVFDSKAAPGFDEFVQERLKRLYAEYQQDRGA
ncbi:plasmid partitioning protein RepB [Rhizobium sp. 1399]|jgi:ParB family chromosome partitioning protein|uniref:plasmid partitioning protein RepB n=1 Tax=Rhizobium sp. 1399 TaxID=2817758 RepID=UPI0028611A49|nr:plasmid partitioning protein RepB [Rhizobium sp. 1399]MDR6670232.1 ParB family chromosome partitioning protein [Rhizobium sp. 1399]